MEPLEKILCLEPAYVSQFPCRRDRSRCPFHLADACPYEHMRRVNDIFERSFSLLCPSAARIILSQDAGFFLRYHTYSISDLKRADQDKPADVPELSYLLELQRASLRILKAADYTINERLVLLGIYLEDAADFIRDGRGNHLDTLLKSYCSPFFKERFQTAVKNISFKPIQHLDFLWKAIKKLADDPALLSPEQLKQARSAFRLDLTPPDLHRVASAWSAGEHNLTRFVLYRFPHLQENLLTHAFYTLFVPIWIPGGIIHNYWVFVTLWKLWEFFLTASATIKRNQLTEKDILTLSSSMARILPSSSGRAAIEEILDGQEDASIELFGKLFHITAQNPAQEL